MNRRTTRRNVLRAGVVGGGAAVLGQVGTEAAGAAVNPVAVPGEDPLVGDLRRALDAAANGMENPAGRDERGRIVVRMRPGTHILRDTLIIGGNTVLDAREATILADFPTVPHTYTKDTVNAHSPTPVYGATFTAAKAAPEVTHATMVLNHVPSATTGRHSAPGTIKILGGTWDPTGHQTRNSSADDRAKATAAPPLNVITMQHTSDVEIEGVTVRNVKWWHAIELNAVHTATVSGCRLQGWVEDPTVGLWHGEAVQLDLAAAGTTWKGAADNTACAGIRLVDNECDGWGRFAGSHTSVAGIVHTDVAIEFNTVRNSSFDAIGPQDTQRLSVRANTIVNCRGGIYLKAAASNLSRVDIIDNTVATTDATRPALAVHDGTGRLTITGVAVFANTVTGPGGYWYNRATARPGHTLQGR